MKQPTRPSAGTILRRGLTLRCPNCGGRTLFRGPFGMHERCRRCGLVFERDEGFYLGATVINYGLTAALVLLPVLVLVFMQRLSTPVALVIALSGVVIVSLLLYRPAKSLWLAAYFLVFPRELAVLDPSAPPPSTRPPPRQQPPGQPGSGPGSRRNGRPGGHA